MEEVVMVGAAGEENAGFVSNVSASICIVF